jgi:hypothetical protein
MTEQPGNPTDPYQPDPPDHAASSDAGAASTPPPAAPVPPPAQSPAAPAAPSPAPAAGRSSYDFNQARTTLQGAHKFDLGIMAAGLIAFLAGFMPFYTLSAFGVSGSWSAWHGFFGWFGVLCALAGAVIVALTLLANVDLPVPVHQAAVAAFGLAAICLVLALFVNPIPSCGGIGGCSSGHGFGYWLALILVLVGLALSVLRMRESTTTRTTTA